MTLEKIDYDTVWNSQLYPALSKFHGTEARDILAEVRWKDKGAFNALYWRTQNWMEGYAGRKPLSDSEERSGLSQEEIGVVRFQDILWRFFGKRLPMREWGSKDLPALLGMVKGGAE